MPDEHATMKTDPELEALHSGEALASKTVADAPSDFVRDPTNVDVITANLADALKHETSKVAALEAQAVDREAKLAAASAVIAELQAKVAAQPRANPLMGHYIDPSASPGAFDRQVERARKAHTDIQDAQRKAGK